MQVSPDRLASPAVRLVKAPPASPSRHPATAFWPPRAWSAFLCWTERALSLAQVVAGVVVTTLIVLALSSRYEWLELAWEWSWTLLGAVVGLIGLLSGLHLLLEGRRARRRVAEWPRDSLRALACRLDGRSYLVVEGDDLSLEARVSRFRLEL